MTQLICFQQQNAQPQAALSSPPSLEQPSVSQKKHPRERKRLKRKRLADDDA